VTLALFGPGDVKNLIVSSVIRTWRRPAHECRSELLPLIEFDQADLRGVIVHRQPLGTILSPVMRGCDSDRGGSRVQPESPGNPSDTYVSTSLLPDLSESDLWAHAQLHGLIFRRPRTGAGPGQSADYFSSVFFAQIFDPETEYTHTGAVFEAGRLKGLVGQQQGAGLTLAWTPSAELPNCRLLPVSFETGRGDFKSCAQDHPKPCA